MAEPILSLVVLTWDGGDHLRRCVESLRTRTDVAAELIVVDNGSGPETARIAADAADVLVRHDENRGFAPGMNAGLAAAHGAFVAFINDDTVFPSGWASRLLEDFAMFERAGLVLPAVTAAGNPVTVRAEPGTEVLPLLPFGEFPSGVVYLLRTATARALGGWNETYPRASAEDLDLCFTVWANDLDVILDTRVLVDHVSQASVRRLPDRRELYRENLRRFLDRWATADPPPPRLESCPPETFSRNLERAKTAVRWIERMLQARERATSTPPPTGPPRGRRRWFKAR